MVGQKAYAATAPKVMPVRRRWFNVRRVALGSRAMGGSSIPAPAGSGVNQPGIDTGTLARAATPAPAGGDRRSFEHAMQALEAELANVGTHLAVDARVRAAYASQLRAMADEMRASVAAGRMSWNQAAAVANELRNTIMEVARTQGTPVGRAWAQAIKSEGPDLNTIIARATAKLHGAGADFNALTAGQKDAVYAEVVASAGRSNPRMTSLLRRLAPAGRGLLVLSIGLSIYQVATAENKAQAAGRELAVTGAGIGGGIAGGALAGLACGPGAPVCVTVGAFVGGALAAFGVDLFW